MYLACWCVMWEVCLNCKICDVTLSMTSFVWSLSCVLYMLVCERCLFAWSMYLCVSIITMEPPLSALFIVMFLFCVRLLMASDSSLSVSCVVSGLFLLLLGRVCIMLSLWSSCV